MPEHNVMKMAKASQADIDMALTLSTFLDSIDKGYVPDAASIDSEKIEWLNEDDGEQCSRIVRELKTIIGHGSFFRVAFGLAVLLDPANELVDPDADTIEHHPKRVQADEQIKALGAQLESANTARRDAQALHQDALAATVAAEHRAEQAENTLHDLVATIDLHTDCMDGSMNVGPLAQYIKAAERIIGERTSTLSSFDLLDHLYRQRDFSRHTFGPGERTAGVLDHIRKELTEIEANPADLSEWIDVVLLAFDGAWRVGYEPQQIAHALAAKQAKNEKRQWPDWRTAEPGKAIEHVREVKA